ncbi:MAG: hypothetical protein ACXAAH_12485 [Promethearchaeota archaeon]|jgi:hypothetical protein
MKNIFIILIACICCASCTTKKNYSLINSVSQVQIDTIHFDNRTGIQYRGTWKVDSLKGRISDMDTENSQIFYRARLVGFDVYTFVDYRHGGYWIKYGATEKYVNLTEPDRAIKKTFSARDLDNINHDITITPVVDSTFIFVKLVRFVSYSPYPVDSIDYTPPVDCICTDTVTMINWIDSVNVIVKDSTIYTFKDSTIYNYVDSLESRIDSFFIVPKKITFELN